MASKLKLESERTELDLSVFGNETSRSEKFDVVSFEIIGQDGKGINISTIVVPEISAPMKNFITRDARNLPHLRNLKLAQSSTDAPFPMSILIGADHYWSIVGDEIREDPYHWTELPSLNKDYYYYHSA